MTLQITSSRKPARQALAYAGLALAVAATPARTQELAATSVYDLDAYVVVANRTDVPIRQVGSSVSVLERYELQKGQQPFLLDALRFEPGFFMRNSGGPGNTFGITTRGLNTNAPTVLLDGIDMSNAADGLIPNLGLIANSSLARAEILKGPQSSLYGANALAGVIALETPDGESAPGVQLDLSYGSHDTYRGSLGYGAATAEGFSWYANITRYETEGFSVLEPSYGAEWADDDGYRNTTVSTKLKQRFENGADVYLTLYSIESRADFDPSAPNPFETPAFSNYTDSVKRYAKLGSHFRLADNWASEASFAFARSDDATNIGSDSYPTEGDRYTLAWQNELELGETWDVVAGAEFENEDNRAAPGNRDNLSLYAENLLRVTEAFSFTLGGRLDDNSEYGNQSTWRGTVNYWLDDDGDLRLRGSYGTSFQAPNFYQLTNEYYGNPELSPESGAGWDVGLDAAFGEGMFFLGLTAFGNDIDDKIIYSFATSRYSNEESYQSIGLETEFRAQLTQSLMLGLSHTYTDAEYGDGAEAERSPRHLYSLRATWRALDDRLALTANALRVGSQYSLRSSVEKQDPYTTVNLAVSYDLSETYELWVRADNLFDEEYQEIAGYLTPGQTFTGGVSLSY